MHEYTPVLRRQAIGLNRDAVEIPLTQARSVCAVIILNEATDPCVADTLAVTQDLINAALTELRQGGVV